MAAADDEAKANAGTPRRMRRVGMAAPVLVALLVGVGVGWALTAAESARAGAHELALAAPASVHPSSAGACAIPT